MGDLGIFAAKLNCRDVKAFHEVASSKWKDCTAPETLPDGTLIEFVETHKVPIAKKLGWFIDMTKRDPEKALPKFLFRMMKLVSRQTVQDEE